MIERRVIDDFVDQQRPVLHQAEHRFPTSPGGFTIIIRRPCGNCRPSPGRLKKLSSAICARSSFGRAIPCDLAAELSGLPALAAIHARARQRPAGQAASDHGRHSRRHDRTVQSGAVPRLDGLSERRGRGPACPIRPQRHRRDSARACLQRLFAYFWGPIPWMIEVAAVLSAAVGHWEDFGVIAAMLLINAGVGFFEEKNADDAIAGAQAAACAQCPRQARRRMEGYSDARAGARRRHSRQARQYRAGRCHGRERRLCQHRPVGADRREPAGRQEGGRRPLFRLHRAPGRDGGGRHRHRHEDLLRQDRQAGRDRPVPLAFPAGRAAHRQFPHLSSRWAWSRSS